MTKKIAYIYVALTVFLWSSVAAVGKILLKGLDNFQVLFYMLITAIIGLFIIILLKKKLKELLKYKLKDYWSFTYMGFLGIFLYSALFFGALMFAPAQEAFIVNYTWPIWVVIFASIILKEKFTARKLTAIILGFIGVYTVVTNGKILEFTITNVKGNLLALGGAVSYGLFSVLGKKDNYDKLNSMFFYHISGLIFAIPALLIFSKITTINLPQLGGLIWLGTFTTGIAFTLWFLALKYGDTAKMSNIIFLTPLLSLVWIYFLIGEKILPSSVIGLVLIVTGIIIQSGDKLQK
ncbi:MAG: DMT family transporter [archaeon]